MKLLVCYEMAHNKGVSTGDAFVTLPDQQALTQAVLDKVREEMCAACEADMRKDCLVPFGKLIFRSVMRLFG